MEPTDNEDPSITFLLTLENNRRYAHTASDTYRLTGASLQPQDKKLPNCVCSTIAEERNGRKRDDDHQDLVTVIVEHNLNEHVLCVLDTKKQSQCKLNLAIKPGEQIAYRTIGKTPVLLYGTKGLP